MNLHQNSAKLKNLALLSFYLILAMKTRTAESGGSSSVHSNASIRQRNKKPLLGAFINVSNSGNSENEKIKFPSSTPNSSSFTTIASKKNLVPKSSCMLTGNNNNISSLLHDPNFKQSSSTTHLETSISGKNMPINENNRKGFRYGMITSFFQDQRIATFIPASLSIGGAAFVYSVAYKHPASTMSAQSILCMLLLSITYCIQPTLSKKYIDKRISVGSIAMVEETFKLIMGSSLFFLSCSSSSPSSSSWKDIISNWDLHTSLIVAAIPAFIYSIQGILTYTSYQYLNAVTFNGLSQTKMLSAAFCCYFLLGKRQSMVQIVSLLLLVCSALFFQGTISTKSILSSSSNLVTKKKESSKNSTEKLRKKQNHNQKYLLYGVLPCMAATFLSGLAGALSQKGLQMTGGANGRNPFLYTMEVSFFTGVFLFLSKVIKFMFSSKNHTQLKPATSNTTASIDDKSSHVDSNYFQYWSWKTLIPIFIKASGGLLTALVHKYAGSVLKGFALVLGLVFSGVLQSFKDEKPLSLDQLFGTLLVLVSTWLHFTCPPAASS